MYGKWVSGKHSWEIMLQELSDLQTEHKSHIPILFVFISNLCVFFLIRLTNHNLQCLEIFLHFFLNF